VKTMTPSALPKSFGERSFVLVTCGSTYPHTARVMVVILVVCGFR
jgi:hypothetical protein